MLNKVLKILQERDDMSLEDAKDLVDETRELIIRNPEEAEMIMAEQLGLEPDYLFDILGF